MVYGDRGYRVCDCVIVCDSREMMAKVYIKAEKINYEELYRESYKEEPFIVLSKEPPHIKHALGTNFCFIYHRCYGFWKNTHR